MASTSETPAAPHLTPATRPWNLLVLLWLVPVLVLSLAAYRIASRGLQDLIEADNRSAALIARDMLQRELDHVVHFIEANAAAPDLVAAVKRRDASAARERLKLMTQVSKQVEFVVLCDLEEYVWASSASPAKEGSHIDPRVAHYQAARKTKRASLSEVYLRNAPQRQTVVAVACPVLERPGGEVIATLFCQIPLGELANRVRGIAVGGAGHIVVVDHRGHLVVHPELDLEAKPAAEFAQLQEVKAAREGEETPAKYVDPLSGESMVGLFLPAEIAGHPWVVVAQQPIAEAWAPVRRMAFQLSLAAAITVAMCLGAVAVIRRMGQKLRREQESLRQILELYEQQRQVVAFEIHDGLAQQLSAAVMTFDALGRSLGTNGAKQQIVAGTELLRESLAEARRLINGLRPTILDDFGVVAAVDMLVREQRAQSGVEIDWRHDVQFDRLAPPLETAVYRVIQEGLANALRHSGSSRVRIALVQRASQIQIEVEDWGRGFDPQKVGQERFGLVGISQRARLLGGRATIESVPHRGTRIAVELPVILPPPRPRKSPQDDSGIIAKPSG